MLISGWTTQPLLHQRLPRRMWAVCVASGIPFLFLRLEEYSEVVYCRCGGELAPSRVEGDGGEVR
jgi:hypothetical protein